MNTGGGYTTGGPGDAAQQHYMMLQQQQRQQQQQQQQQMNMAMIRQQQQARDAANAGGMATGQQQAMMHQQQLQQQQFQMQQQQMQQGGYAMQPQQGGAMMQQRAGMQQMQQPGMAAMRGGPPQYYSGPGGQPTMQQPPMQPQQMQQQPQQQMQHPGMQRHNIPPQVLAAIKNEPDQVKRQQIIQEFNRRLQQQQQQAAMYGGGPGAAGQQQPGGSTMGGVQQMQPMTSGGVQQMQPMTSAQGDDHQQQQQHMMASNPPLVMTAVNIVPIAPPYCTFKTTCSRGRMPSGSMYAGGGPSPSPSTPLGMGMGPQSQQLLGHSQGQSPMMRQGLSPNVAMAGMPQHQQPQHMQQLQNQQASDPAAAMQQHPGYGQPHPMQTHPQMHPTMQSGASPQMPMAHHMQQQQHPQGMQQQQHGLQGLGAPMGQPALMQMQQQQQQAAQQQQHQAQQAAAAAAAAAADEAAEAKKKEEQELYDKKVKDLKAKYMEAIRRMIERAEMDQQEAPVYAVRMLEVFENKRTVSLELLDKMYISIPRAIERKSLTFPVLDALREWANSDGEKEGESPVKEEVEEKPEVNNRRKIFPDPWPTDMRWRRLRVPDHLARTIRSPTLDRSLMERKKRIAENRLGDGPIWDARRMRYADDLEEEFAELEKDERKPSPSSSSVNSFKRGAPSPTGASPNENILQASSPSSLPPVVNSIPKSIKVENGRADIKPLWTTKSGKNTVRLSDEAIKELSGLRWTVEKDDCPISGASPDVSISILPDVQFAPPLRVLVPIDYPATAATVLHQQSFPAGSTVHAQLAAQFTRRLSALSNPGRLSSIREAYRTAVAALSTTSVRGALTVSSASSLPPTVSSRMPQANGQRVPPTTLRPPPKFLAPVENQKPRMVF